MNLNHEIYVLAGRTGQHDLKAHSVQCVVVAGKDLVDADKKKSFDLFRTSLNSVTAITFDELLARLKEIDRVFSREKEAQAQSPAPVGFSDNTNEEAE